MRDPPTRDALAAMLARGGIAPQAALRGDAPPVADDAGALDLIAREPRWLERPIVETAAGVRLCRPPALVHEILP